jgi:hypothetical protein
MTEFSNRPDFDLVLTTPAPRAMANKLHDAVAAAVIDFLTTALRSSLFGWSIANKDLVPPAISATCPR